ncbi:hypothetical protein CBS470a_013309 [Colletotrichum nupharicola]|nr:hypothetical protein CBS470a_013309 [Colletotrichum nupharicola]
MTIGAILKCTSYSLAQMFVGRIILGVGNGINTATAPIWQTETAPAHWRGKLVMFEMMMNIAGFSLCNWINYGLSFAGGAVAWRFPLAFQITNYVIVQITPIGIQNLGWKFWIVFTVLNAAFLPVIYLFYPETANRTLEDLDEYYRNNPPLVVIGDTDAIGTKRPQKYVDHEEAQVERVAHEDGVTEAADKKTSRTEAGHVE